MNDPVNTPTLRARLRCNAVTKADGGYETSKCFAVAGNTPENKAFSTATPNAVFEIVISNPDAKNFFVPGEDYLFDISPAPKPA